MSKNAAEWQMAAEAADAWEKAAGQHKATVERLEAEAISQAHALRAAIESANLWTEIADNRAENIELLKAKNAALLVELATALNYIATQDAENAALRAELDAEVTESTANMIALQYVKEDYEELRAENAALRTRLDACCAELLADAEGR